MDESTLLLTKLSHPQPSRWHLPRHHLTEVLTEGRARRLTALIAPAGHGKTCTLAHFLGQGDSAFVWLQLEPADSNVAQFATYVALGIERDLGGGSRTRLFLEHNSRTGAGLVGHLLPLLVADLQDVPRGTIVLDDFHLIALDSPVVELVSSLLHHASGRVPFYISSRVSLPFPTTRLMVSLEAAEVTQEDLLFTPGEVFTYVKEVAGLSLDDPALQNVCHLTEGWPAALVLLASAARRRGLTNLLPDGGIPSDLFRYLAEEVYQSLSPDLQQFMEESSILDACTPPVCDAVMERRDSAVCIHSVLNSSLLLTRLGPDSFRYHHLMQRFLQERLRLKESGDRFRLLHRRAGDWFLRSDIPEEAVRHFLQGGWLNEGARLVEELVPLWTRTNKLERLRGLLALLPVAVKESHPWISLCEARHQFISGKQDTALGLARMALKAFEERGDGRGSVHAHTVIGQIHVTSQEYDQAHASYESAASHLSPELRYEEGVLLLRCAALALLSGTASVSDVEAKLHRSLAIAAEVGDRPGEASASDLLGIVRQRKGDYASAIRFLERSVELLRSLGEPSYEIGLNLAWAYFVAGRFQEAIAICEPVFASSRHKLRRAHAAVNLVDAYTRVGEFTRALGAARAAHAVIEELGHKELAVHLNIDLSACYRLSGQGETAMPYARDALQTSKKTEDANLLTLAAIEAALLHLFHTGNAAAAAKMASKALARLAEGEEHWSKMLLSFTLAIAEFRLARTESRPEAARILKEALADCSRRGYDSFVLHEWQLAAAVVVYGLSHAEQPDTCLSLIQRMKEHLPPALRESGIPLHERDARMVPAAWHALQDEEARESFASLLTETDRRRVANLGAGPSTITIHCLGPLTVKVGAQQVNVKTLRTRKCGQFLTLLLAQKSGVPREQLIERLWPDLDSVAADTSLRVSLYHLRRMLEPHLGGKSRSKYIQSEGGLVWFVRHPEVEVDVDRFRDADERAEVLEGTGDLAGAVAAYEECCRLYMGDLCQDDPYSSSLEDLRAGMKEVYLRALEWLGRYYWKDGLDPARAILHYKQLLGADSAHEPAHQALIQLYLEDGQVAMARTQYSACREALMEQLGVPPSRATESLLQLTLVMESEIGHRVEKAAPTSRPRGRSAVGSGEL